MIWSNGQTDGQITKLKLISAKCIVGGKLDSLEAPNVEAP